MVEKVRQSRPAGDIEMLRRAFEFAAEQHRAQLRKSGDPYLSHPLEVAHILRSPQNAATLCPLRTCSEARFRHFAHTFLLRCCRVIPPHCYIRTYPCKMRFT